MVDFRPESWAQFYPDCLPLARAHHEELEGLSGDPFDLDVAQSEALCRSKVAEITTARDGVDLIGYTIWLVTGNLMSKNVRVATQGPFFVAPLWRGGTVAFRLFEASLKQIAQRGVARAFPHHWLTGDSGNARRLFERHGARPLELVYTMEIR